MDGVFGIELGASLNKIIKNDFFIFAAVNSRKHIIHIKREPPVYKDIYIDRLVIKNTKRNTNI